MLLFRLSALFRFAPRMFSGLLYQNRVGSHADRPFARSPCEHSLKKLPGEAPPCLHVGA